MAEKNKARWANAGMLIFGIALVVIAFWDVDDQSFCAAGCGNLFRFISAPLYEHFGHWGARIAILVIGGAFIAWSFVKPKSDTSDSGHEAPSNS